MDYHYYYYCCNTIGVIGSDNDLHIPQTLAKFTGCKIHTLQCYLLNFSNLTLLWFIIIPDCRHTHTHILVHNNLHTIVHMVDVRYRAALRYGLLLIPASRLPAAHNAARWLNVIVLSLESLLLLIHSFPHVLVLHRLSLPWLVVWILSYLADANVGGQQCPLEIVFFQVILLFVRYKWAFQMPHSVWVYTQ